jgi:hypothetical protein
MDFKIPWRRIATGAGVLLLHVLFLYILAISMHIFPVEFHAREIIFNLMPPNGNHTEQQDLHIPTPKLIRPEQSEPNAITVLPQLNKELQQPQSGVVPGDLGGVGRYLYNCSGMFYEQLPANERAGCLLNKWDERPSNSPLLGVAKPSQFDSVIAKRHEAPPPDHRNSCDQTAINSNLGLPCFNFDGAH